MHELLNQLLFNIFISHFRLQEIDLHSLSHALTHKHDAHDIFVLVNDLGCNTEGVTTFLP